MKCGLTFESIEHQDGRDPIVTLVSGNSTEAFLTGFGAQAEIGRAVQLLRGVSLADAGAIDSGDTSVLDKYMEPDPDNPEKIWLHCEAWLKTGPDSGVRCGQYITKIVYFS